MLRTLAEIRGFALTLELDIQRVIPCHGLVIDSEEDLAQFHKAMKTAFR